MTCSIHACKKKKTDLSSELVGWIEKKRSEWSERISDIKEKARRD